ncbi:hypothetical protein AOC36_09635 [Erysipelothrix larvae]|uniref:PcfJ-like protein n=1 Tax=Erysipelothrix larvae TaxID=1514105 RepID=A0A0X8H1G8_9FIRM|nr:PcfJ domain-containing protein [Erysipelothrix larvae]AMC94234.1 hypothetical protein AOC36_09635 [Erysipelothrix larvae]
MDLLDKLATLKLKEYTANSFRKYWMEEETYGSSRKKRIHKKTIFEVYEIWRGRLICRLFYLEEGCINKQIYREAREITRYLAGSNKKIISGIIAGMSGTFPNTAFSFNSDTGSLKWKKVNLHKYVPGASCGYYIGTQITWKTLNDYLPILNQSCHKYSAAEYVYDRTDHYPDTLFYYLHKYDKIPILEVLVKKGLNHLLDETKIMRWSKSTLPEILGISRQDFCFLEAGVSLQFLRKNIDFIKQKKLSCEETKLFEEFHNGKYKYLSEHITVLNKKTLSYIVANDYEVSIYNDYLRFAKKLGYELYRNRVLYPPDLHRAHDDAYKNLNEVELEKYAEGFKIHFEMNKAHILERDGLLIRPAQEPFELINESKFLKHCVKSYVDKVADGTAEILFVRKKDTPNEPYITVEVMGKRITQARGKNNCPAPKEVQEFLVNWSKKNKIEYHF